MVHTALVGVAALALAGGTTAAASAAQLSVTAPTHHTATQDFRRACAATTRPGMMFCMTLIRTGVRQHTEASLSNKQPTSDGYGPSDLQSAYNLPSSTAGSGESVAVVDAYNDPDAVSNVATYRSTWGLPACDSSTGAGCLTVVNQSGATSPLPKNSGSTGWATEESLDVDMVSAICPNCHIYLVEADSPSITNLGTGVDSAVSVLNVDFVSNSYGGSQSKSDPTYDTDYYQHPGVAVVASAGDDGYGVSYPAASQYVTSAGGTTLKVASGTTRGWTETVWSGTGSGCSKYEAKPSWQTDTGCSNRTDNDVAADANPSTGVAIYDTYDQDGWLEVGGTSVASPLIASVFALAGTPTAGTYPSSYPYAHTSDLNNVTKGKNGTCSPAYLCHGEVGYNGPTGWGTPNGTAAFTG
jgi:subtilase family serine protease